MGKVIKNILIITIVVLIIGGIIMFIFNNKNKKDDYNDMTSEKFQNEETLFFGKYYNNGEDLEPIEWTVLDKTDGKKLIVTKYAIDSVPYNNNLESTTWDKSDIRKWLNSEFYNLAFDEEEKRKIVLTKIYAQENPNHPNNTNIGNDTEDNVFLLSYQEVTKYFQNENDRLLKSTKYAVSKGCYTNASGNVAWWTRSAGLTETSPEYLASAGDFGVRNHEVNEKIIGTRPAMWIKE